jgi:hypothetical protein
LTCRKTCPPLLSPAPAYLAAQPVDRIVAASAFKRDRQILRGDGRHSMRAFAEAIGARPVTSPGNLLISTRRPIWRQRRNAMGYEPQADFGTPEVLRHRLSRSPSTGAPSPCPPAPA